LRTCVYATLIAALAAAAMIVPAYLASIAHGRDYCPRPPYMRGTNECPRIPTVAKPYCPAP